MEFKWDSKIQYWIIIVVLASTSFFIWKGAADELTRLVVVKSAEITPVQGTTSEFWREVGNEVLFSTREGVFRKQEELIASNEDFLFVDLDLMTLTVFKHGSTTDEFELIGKGRPGSFFETPTGMYRIKLKEENHFSSIGEVWMPWSLHFFGNYFIHGRPYYPDGTPTSSAFSGGCIRLRTEDAIKLYEATEIGMPVLIAGASISAPSSGYFSKAGGRALSADITAESFLAADFETGQVLLEKRREDVFSISSITKLMAGLTAIESISGARVLTVLPADVDPADPAGFVEGEKFESGEFIYPLFLSSSNTSARILERSAWGFVDSMNQKAQAIGMARTHFADAGGEAGENSSTATDLFRLFRFIRDHKNPIFKILEQKSYQASSQNGLKDHEWRNMNWPADEADFVAGKSSVSAVSGEAFAGLFRVKLSESEERPIIIIVLSSRDRVRDVNLIRAHLEDHFVYGKVLTGGRKLQEEIPAGASMYEAIQSSKLVP